MRNTVEYPKRLEEENEQLLQGKDNHEARWRPNKYPQLQALTAQETTTPKRDQMRLRKSKETVGLATLQHLGALSPHGAGAQKLP